MSDINFNGYSDEEFFKLFLDAVKETYGEYCTFKEREEDLSGYSEPVFEKSIEEAEQRITSIEKIIPKVTNEAAQHKITADYAKRHLEQCEAALSAEQNKREEVEQQLAKANERVKELEQNQLPIENGENRYGLDVSYFRNVINRELNRSLDNYKPDELARVLARISRTADKSVMFEPEFSNKFAIEKKIEGVQVVIDALAKRGMLDTLIGFAINSEVEQLRKEQE